MSSELPTFDFDYRFDVAEEQQDPTAAEIWFFEKKGIGMPSHIGPLNRQAILESVDRGEIAANTVVWSPNATNNRPVYAVNIEFIWQAIKSQAKPAKPISFGNDSWLRQLLVLGLCVAVIAGGVAAWKALASIELHEAYQERDELGRTLTSVDYYDWLGNMTRKDVVITDGEIEYWRMSGPVNRNGNLHGNVTVTEPSGRTRVIQVEDGEIVR